MTGIEIIIKNFWPKVRNEFSEIEDQGQHIKNWGGQFQ